MNSSALVRSFAPLVAILVSAASSVARGDDPDPVSASPSVEVPALPVDSVSGLVATPAPIGTDSSTPPQERKASWLVIPGIFSFPETGPGIALKARVRDVGGVPGFVDATVAGTWKGQSDFNLQWVRDSIGGKWRTREILEVGRFPATWHGPGNPAEDSMESRYTPTYVLAESRLARYLPGGWAIEALLGLDAESVDEAEGAAFRLLNVVDRDGGLFLFAGGALEYDGRDLSDNPRRGRYLRILAQTSLPGSESLWSLWQNDLSQALSAGSWTAVGRVRTIEAWGEVPFWKSPSLGSREALRGLPDPRLRGEAVQCAGLEIRRTFPPFFRLPWQLAGFVEEGRAGDHSGVWSADPTPAGGGGVRLLLDGGKAVLRIDYGVSPVGSGLYIDFGQAF